ncbi:MAG: dihydroorotase [Actinomycetota bacterium]
MPSRLVLRAARVVDPASGRDEKTDLLIEDETIASLEAGASAPKGKDIDCDGLVVAPGLVDLHAHLREPGGEQRETIETGSCAAAAGGFTAVVAMANTDPVADNAAVVQEVLSLAEKAGRCDVFPAGAITRGLKGEELAEIGEMAEQGVRIFSDDGKCVDDAQLLRVALEYAKAFDVIIAEHCEDSELARGWQMHEGHTSSLLGLNGVPSEAEDVIVSRDISLARLTGGRLHILHLSSARSAEEVRRAKGDGTRVTSEVTPHHLVFTDEDLAGYDTNLKVNPPLRSPEDRDALRRAVADGTVDAIASDHAPRAAEEKEVEFDAAGPGSIGLETALAAGITELVEPGILTMTRLIESLSVAPAGILGASEHGGPIEPGRPANLVVFDPEAAWEVRPPFASMSENSAFLGRTLRGRVVHTLLRGEFTHRDGRPAR